MHAPNRQLQYDATSVPPLAADPATTGRWVADRLTSTTLPLLAIQTSYSLLLGTDDPAAWGAALGELAGLPGPACQAALADAGDLLGLPDALRHWGREHLAVGSCLPLLDTCRAPDGTLLLLAPDAAAYARLCRLLSWRHEEPAAWEAWLAGGRVAPPELGGLVTLLDRADAWGALFADAGATVLQRADRQPWTAPCAWPVAAVPLLSHLHPGRRRSMPLLDAIRRRGQASSRQPRRAPGALTDLAELPRCFAEHPDQLARGIALRERDWYRPAPPDARGNPPLQMPPSHWGDPDRHLRELAWPGLLARYGDDPPAAARQRFDHELAVIARKGFSSYLLTVHDLARDRRTCGRGSGASSLICYCLGITNVDPIRHNLVFERFLSDERHDPPDIDVDFPWDERDAVLQAAFQRYGSEHVAMVATHQRLQRWGAVRAVASACGHDRQHITAFKNHQRAAERFEHAGPPPAPTGRVAEAPTAGWDEILAGAAELEGMPRNLGLHCGGIVITTAPIRDLVPVHPAAKTIDGWHLPTIAWEKDGAEQLGLVKIDLLGNRSLAVIRDCLHDLAATGIRIDEERWHPEDDPLTKRLLDRGQTIGCFYIESPAMRLLNARAGDLTFDRLVVHSSIIRPAANQWIATYLERLHAHRRTGSHDEAWYPHPALRGLLSESYGILSYQEDVMLVARDLAGFDIRQQNALRKALGKSDTRQRLAGLADDFAAGCRRRGVSEAVREHVWSMITSFAGYSFAKAHSASYAMESYRCAWLKAHHPACFMARVIDNQGGFYSVAAYIEEARRCGVRILPPCVVDGAIDTRALAADRLQLGLDRIHGLGAACARRIVEERGLQPFRGLVDLFCRCRPTVEELRALLWAGALDRLLARLGSGQRSWLAGQVAGLPRPPRRDRQQRTLAFIPDRPDDPPVPDRPPLSQALLDRRALHVLGCLPRCHPLQGYPVAGRRSCCADLRPALAGETLTLLVLQVTRRQVTATQRRGRDGAELAEPLQQAMAFVTLEDETGLIESVWFPDSYRRYGIHLEQGGPLWVRGRVAVEFDVATLEVDRAWLPTGREPPRIPSDGKSTAKTPRTTKDPRRGG